ncbi:transmembrane protein 139 [Bufo gargarizans]|uniref:transmembrane protein 139 n=1 Tax=Bufo gargarizans TaxID=30331 RepID=UPI001CF0E57F|nr:transmembrane protein 139 [Bufo gargarizans]
MAAPSYVWSGIQRAVVTFGMAFILIGVVLLTVSENVFIIGICFLSAGSLAVLCYLFVILSTCVKKSRAENEENPTEGETRTTGQNQTEANSSQFDAPRYEDAILYGSATVWTVTLGSPPDIEPPPYHSALERRVAVTDLRLPNPTLLRISSDIHEVKRSEFMPEASLPEPLTPPPTYNESMPQWEEVFFPSQEEG